MAQAEAPCDVRTSDWRSRARCARSTWRGRRRRGGARRRRGGARRGGGRAAKDASAPARAASSGVAVAVGALREALSADVGVLIKHAALVSARVRRQRPTRRWHIPGTPVLMTRRRRRRAAPVLCALGGGGGADAAARRRGGRAALAAARARARPLQRRALAAVHAGGRHHVEVRTHAAFLVVMCAMPMVLARTTVRLLPDLMRAVRDALGACEAGASAAGSIFLRHDGGPPARPPDRALLRLCDARVDCHPRAPQSRPTRRGRRASPSTPSTPAGTWGATWSSSTRALPRAVRFSAASLLARGVPTSLAAEAPRRFSFGAAAFGARARGERVFPSEELASLQGAHLRGSRALLGARLSFSLVRRTRCTARKETEDKPAEERSRASA